MEAMVVEQLVAEYWKMEGYFVETRVSFKKERSWPDIDVMAYNPTEKKLVLAEVKAVGGKKTIRGLNTENTKDYLLKFFEDVKYFFNSGAYKQNGRLKNIEIETIQLHFAGNINIEKTIIYRYKENNCENLSTELTKIFEKCISEIDFFKKKEIILQIDSTYNIINKLFTFDLGVEENEEENNEEEYDDKCENGKRYGSILDLIREMNRYFHKKNMNYLEKFVQLYKKDQK